MDLFDSVFGAFTEEIEFELRDSLLIPWADYWLNPRQLRGSDFLMRWSQGVWSETRLREALNQSGEFYALSYGPSGTAPEDDPRAVELYFLRLEAAGLGKLKRPDLLIFRDADRIEIENLVFQIASLDPARDSFEKAVEELPFTAEEHPLVQQLLKRALLPSSVKTVFG